MDYAVAPSPSVGSLSNHFKVTAATDAKCMSADVLGLNACLQGHESRLVHFAICKKEDPFLETTLRHRQPAIVFKGQS